MIKVAYIIPTLSQGGAEMQQINILNGLDHNRFIVKVLVLKDKKELIGFVNPDLINKIEFIGFKNFLSIGKLFELYRELKSFSPDIIHSQMYNANILSRLISYFFKSRPLLINHSHGLSEWIDKPRLFLDQFTHSTVDKFIVVSSASMKLRTTREKYPQNKVQLLANSVSDKLTMIPKRPLSSTITFGIACRLIPLKNVQGTINLVSSLSRLGIECKLKVAGDGPEREKLEEIASSCGVEVEFLGFTENMDAFFESIDVFCLSSTTEDLPLSIIEAMMSGKPVISASVGGIPNLVKGLHSAHLVDDFFDESEVNCTFEFIKSLYGFDYHSELTQFAMSKFSNSGYCNSLQNMYVDLVGTNE
ncbi:glycosyltransferase [Vibrio sp. J1-1]|uniref:glycosyltransferase n=1 Tax=Vibrio sp. J1-1 TaxID=2912251 RepID=UPI001F1D6295|nr:glycosyltransferase [Vibrio sp. J1-1]MCF7482049.1 glycosyltransferase [Vibrio sp. J1-1]